MGDDTTGQPRTVDFAAAARRLAATSRRLGLIAPSYRTPPRVVGVDRTLRRHHQGAVVAVRLRDRPWPAVLADMIEGVVRLNGSDPATANRLRADLWSTVADLAPAASPDVTRLALAAVAGATAELAPDESHSPETHRLAGAAAELAPDVRRSPEAGRLVGPVRPDRPEPRRVA